MSKSAETSTMQTIIYNAAIGTQFMDIMQDYMECQESPTFNVQQGLHDLYTDLSNLYHNNAQ